MISTGILVIELDLIEDQVFHFGGFSENVLIFGVDMSSSAHIDNKKKTLVLGKGPTQGFCKMYSINFTVTKNKVCFSLNYEQGNSYLFVNGTEIYKFKSKDSEIVASPLCLGNISRNSSVNNMKKNWIYWLCLWC